MSLQRLQRSRDIELLYRTGRRLTTPHLRLFWASNLIPNDRLTVVISKKISKKATQRNRLRRIIRECIRATHTNVHPTATGHDIVMVVRATPHQKENLLNECQSILVRAFKR